MFNQDFKKILDLIQKTGDKVIIMPEFGEPFAILPFDQYEEIVSESTDYRTMSEEEILTRVNREIALWKQSQKDFDLDENVPLVENTDLYSKRNDFEQDWVCPDFEQFEQECELNFEDDDFIETQEKSLFTDFEADDRLSVLNDRDTDFVKEDKIDEIIKEQEGIKPLAYEAVAPPPSLKKDLPIIDIDDEEADNFRLKVEDDKKIGDEFLVEPIE